MSSWTHLGRNSRELACFGWFAQIKVSKVKHRSGLEEIFEATFPELNTSEEMGCGWYRLWLDVGCACCCSYLMLLLLTGWASCVVLFHGDVSIQRGG